ncbi:MAG: carboxypeptidase-like regulatory domain-containing protein, partial [Phycisphaerales bacterium]
MRGSKFSLAIVIVLAIFLAGPVLSTYCFAQQASTAGIYGSVVDAQGGAIPGARIMLTHIERNQVREATTNEVGEYTFPLIPIGRYKLGIQHSGFKAFEQTGIELQVNDNAKIDVTLEVGDVNTR